MTVCNSNLVLGYDLEKWNAYSTKEPINIDLSPSNNSHIILCGLSGSGKSYCEQILMAKLKKLEPHGEIYFADYKGDPAFLYLSACNHYYSYNSTLDALTIVHNRLHERQSGVDTSRNPITLIWDEYMAQMLSLISQDKKAASVIMGKVSEILLLGRSLSVRLIVTCQRPDALAFPAGSRLNYGVVCILGSSASSIYEMLIPDFREAIKGCQFHRGEGVVVLQGAECRFIKVPTVRNMERLQRCCKSALDAHRPLGEA